LVFNIKTTKFTKIFSNPVVYLHEPDCYPLQNKI
jgi:hypothetical protein